MMCTKALRLTINSVTEVVLCESSTAHHKQHSGSIYPVPTNDLYTPLRYEWEEVDIHD